jgi:hypothetical protein
MKKGERMTDENLVDFFDRVRGGMEGRPDVTMTRLSSLQSVDPLVGNVSTFMVQTVRERERGDTIFLQVATKDGNIRIVIPPKVAKVIHRQYETLTTKVRSKLGKEEAQKRKDAGIEPFGGKRHVRKAG